MKTKDKFFTLLKEGFTLKTLRKMNESQLNVLYKKVVKEQIDTQLASASEKADELKQKVQGIQQAIGEEDELTEDWGSSDQSIMNASIHRDLGEPEEMPSPFDRKLRAVAEGAVDFYWDDWQEYKTDRDGLIDSAVRLYLRSYFPEKFNLLIKMFQPVKNDGEIDEADINNINPFKGRQTQSPKQVGPSSDDGMGNYQDGMDIFEGKKKPSKMKTPITTLGMFEEDSEYAICMDSIQGKYGPKKTWKKNAEKKFDACVSQVRKDMKENKVRQIEESIVSLLKNYKKPTMTKKDLLEQGTKEAPVKTPTKTPSRPERKTPYKPKHKPKPKAGETQEIPSFLKFDNLNITFRDE